MNENSNYAISNSTILGINRTSCTTESCISLLSFVSLWCNKTRFVTFENTLDKISPKFKGKMCVLVSGSGYYNR